MKSFFFAGLLLLLIGIISVVPSQAQSDDAPPPIVVDCDVDENCVELEIVGDPIEHGCLELNGTAFSDPCSIRGHFDPSLWQADDGTLWMAYTRVTLFFPDPDDLETFAPNYATYLARSNDGGRTWEYVTTITESEVYAHPTNGDGIIAHEVPDITQNPDGTWSLVWVQYTRGYQVTEFNDPVIARKDAATPEGLADAETQLHMSGWGGSPIFVADYAAPLNEFPNCLGMTEPSIFTADGRSYTVVECISIDISDPTFPRVYEKAAIELFEWVDGAYEHVGTLLTYEDAVALTDGLGTSLVVTQPDVVQARNGDWILLLTPSNDTQNPPFQGCRVLTIDDLEAATIRRNVDGTPMLRASITATSQHLGAGQCTYNAASDTGVLFGVGFSLPEGGLRLNLIATGVHP